MDSYQIAKTIDVLNKDINTSSSFYHVVSENQQQTDRAIVTKHRLLLFLSKTGLSLTISSSLGNNLCSKLLLHK